MKAYVTKWALTQGILEVENPEFYEKYLCFGRCKELLNPVDWFNTRPAAIERAEAMRVNKIASLRKQIAKFERMKFS
jgi:hypothetical protein